MPPSCSDRISHTKTHLLLISADSVDTDMAMINWLYMIVMYQWLLEDQLTNILYHSDRENLKIFYYFNEIRKRSVEMSLYFKLRK
jgi:hypothetical protein